MIVHVLGEVKGQEVSIGKGTDHVHGQDFNGMLSYCLMKPLMVGRSSGRWKAMTGSYTDPTAQLTRYFPTLIVSLS